MTRGGTQCSRCRGASEWARWCARFTAPPDVILCHDHLPFALRPDVVGVEIVGKHREDTLYHGVPVLTLDQFRMLHSAELEC